MDPNPLQYQTPDENQPLYRAALLSAGAVVLLIVVAMGINFAIKHPPSLASGKNSSAATSPDDAVGDVKGRLTQDAMSTLGGGKIGAEGIRNLAEGNEGYTPTASANYEPAHYTTPVVPQRAGGAVAFGADTAPAGGAMGPTNGSVLRHYGSINPESLAPLIMGR